MSIKWTLEKIKEILLNNNSLLLSSDDYFYSEINKGVAPMKVKLNTKCFFCKDGIINNRDIDHIINRHQNKCTNCSKKLLSEKMTKQNKEWWKNEEYRNKIIENARSRTKNKK